ncbi:hypothetical protein HDU76_006687 [Blyttiomyces sp. JEL0837]|nr:hypothetical protein HDU76_006687 [Blyttiomyces sp. JEL0837]
MPIKRANDNDSVHPTPEPSQPFSVASFLSASEKADPSTSSAMPTPIVDSTDNRNEKPRRKRQRSNKSSSLERDTTPQKRLTNPIDLTRSASPPSAKDNAETQPGSRSPTGEDIKTQISPTHGTVASPKSPKKRPMTTKRAKQNREAQRNFRERRKEYIRALETQVSKLEELVITKLGGEPLPFVPMHVQLQAMGSVNAGMNFGGDGEDEDDGRLGGAVIRYVYGPPPSTPGVPYAQIPVYPPPPPGTSTTSVPGPTPSQSPVHVYKQPSSQYSPQIPKVRHISSPPAGHYTHQPSPNPSDQSPKQRQLIHINSPHHPNHKYYLSTVLANSPRVSAIPHHDPRCICSKSTSLISTRPKVTSVPFLAKSSIGIVEGDNATIAILSKEATHTKQQVVVLQAVSPPSKADRKELRGLISKLQEGVHVEEKEILKLSVCPGGKDDYDQKEGKEDAVGNVGDESDSDDDDDDDDSTADTVEYSDHVHRESDKEVVEEVIEEDEAAVGGKKDAGVVGAGEGNIERGDVEMKNGDVDDEDSKVRESEHVTK